MNDRAAAPGEPDRLTLNERDQQQPAVHNGHLRLSAWMLEQFHRKIDQFWVRSTKGRVEGETPQALQDVEEGLLLMGASQASALGDRLREPCDPSMAHGGGPLTRMRPPRPLSHPAWAKHEHLDERLRYPVLLAKLDTLMFPSARSTDIARRATETASPVCCILNRSRRLGERRGTHR